MEDMIKRAVNLGLGAVLFTKEKIESAVDDLVEKGEVGKEEGKDLVNKLMAKGEDVRKEIEESFQKFIDEIELPTRKEFDVLAKEVEGLKKEVSKLKKTDKS